MSYDRNTNKPRRNDFGPVGEHRQSGSRPQGGALIHHGTWKSRRNGENTASGGSDRQEWRKNEASGGNNSAKPSEFKHQSGEEGIRTSSAKPQGGNGGYKYREYHGKSGSGYAQRSFDRAVGGGKAQNRPGQAPNAVRPGATDGMPARRLALDVIRKVTENGAYASLALDEKLHGCTLSAADRRFAARLVYDTLDNIAKLDWALHQVMARPDTDIRLVNVLRLGACQLLLGYRVPDNAATDTAVRLCREIGLEGLVGVCNGILRNLIRQRDGEGIQWPDPAEDLVKALSVETSTPEWLIRRLQANWGEETAEQLLRWRDKRGGIILRPNLMRLDDAGFETLLQKKVWEHEPAMMPHAVRVKGMIDITADADWQGGMYSIQSEGSQCAVLALGVRPGWKVLDCCAAPGGKTAYIAELLNGGGRVQAWDKHEHRVDLITAQAKRLHLENVRPIHRDASVYREDLDMTFDAVLLDAPCSGTGDMAEKPDIKLRLKEENVDALIRTQAELLDAVCPSVKIGGVLVYATCSLLKAENEDQVKAFLERHPEFEPEKLPVTIPEALRQHETLGLQLMAHRDGVGGFYVCRMKRKR
ncbi:MAG: 16S rRNA (cytosine(967)-C(5))-methyltransferase RsmB [Clostridia bacterium]|nr:16S rRNA (cytosine(967)-C(5))-methyltransferase RsmB [Clostridia bacterium]